MPKTYEDVVEMLVPELQKRGIFWSDYKVPGGTYRENFNARPGQAHPLPTHPAAELIWEPPSRVHKQHEEPTQVNQGTSDGHFTDWW